MSRANLPLAAVVAIAVCVSALSARAAEPEKALSAVQKREVTDLLNKFRRAGKTPEQRDQVIDRVLEIGGPAPEQLLAAVDRELQPLRQRYQTDFLKQTMDLLRTRLKGPDLKEVEACRQTVRDLAKDANLTKEAIHAKGDPAMSKLDQLLAVDRNTVLKDSPALQAQRTELLAVGVYWQRIREFQAKEANAGAAGPVRFVDLLRAEEELCVFLALAADDTARKTLLTNSALESRLPLEEARGIRDLNRMRVLLGLKPLRIDLALCDAARDHSKDMVTQKFFGHESPVPGKKTPWDRAKNFGTSAGAENIAGGCSRGVEANQMWFYSPGHHRNMLGDHARVGLGNCDKVWTLMLGG